MAMLVSLFLFSAVVAAALDCDPSVLRGLNETELMELPFEAGVGCDKHGCPNGHSAGDVVVAADGISGYPWEFIELSAVITQSGVGMGPATINASAVLYANVSAENVPASEPIAVSSAITKTQDCGFENVCEVGFTFDLSDQEGFVIDSADGGHWIGLRYSVCADDVPVLVKLAISGLRTLSRYRAYPSSGTWQRCGLDNSTRASAISGTGRRICPESSSSSSYSSGGSVGESLSSLGGSDSSAGDAGASSDSHAASSQQPLSSSLPGPPPSSASSESSRSPAPSSSSSSIARETGPPVALIVVAVACAAIVLACLLGAVVAIAAARRRRRMMLLLARQHRGSDEEEAGEEMVLSPSTSADRPRAPSLALPPHTANALADPEEMARPHTEADALKLATAALADIDRRAMASAADTGALSGVLRVDPSVVRFETNLSVDAAEATTAAIKVTNVAFPPAPVRYCLVGFGGRAFVVGLRGRGAGAGGDRVKRVGRLDSGETAEETVVVHARCATVKTKPALLAMAVGGGWRASGVVSIAAHVRPHVKIDPEELESIKRIGEGSFGVVYRATWRGDDVAVKRFKMLSYSPAEMEEVTKEVETQANLHNAYVVTTCGIIVDEMSLVTEFFKLGSLDKLLASRPPELTFALRARLALDVARGMLFLVKCDMLHRDLKPGNVLVASMNPRSESACCKLTDFGTARMVCDMGATSQATKGVGTPAFMAPEVLDPPRGSRPAYSEASEVYSYGITLYSVMSAAEAFAECSSTIEIYKAVATGGRPDLGAIAGVVPDALAQRVRDLMTDCWAQDPRRRCGFAAIVDRAAAISGDASAAGKTDGESLI